MVIATSNYLSTRNKKSLPLHTTDSLEYCSYEWEMLVIVFEHWDYGSDVTWINEGTTLDFAGNCLNAIQFVRMQIL
jgi:hypothetical protein